MTTLVEARKSWQLQYINAYIYRRYSSTVWDTEPVDVSMDLLFDKIEAISYALDPYAFDVGLFFSSNTKITLDNARGRYSDTNNSRSIWAGFKSRDNSIFKLECGYVDEDGNEITNTAFEGFIKSSTIEEDANDNFTFEVYGFENMFADLAVTAGSLTSNTVKNIIYSIMNRSEITSLITVDLANINPDNNVQISAPSVFNNQLIKSVLSNLLIISNSVAYVDRNRVFHCTPRTESDDVKLTLSYNSQSGQPDNIFQLRRFTGEARVFNLIKSEDEVYSSYSDTELLEIYGVKEKKINMDCISDSSVAQSVVDRVRREFQYPKEEFEIETDYLGDAIELLDKVLLEVFPDTLDTGSPEPICGIAICGEAVVTDYAGGLIVDGSKIFKVLKITHDPKRMSTTLLIRNTGYGPDDGSTGSTGELAICGFAVCGVGAI